MIELSELEEQGELFEIIKEVHEDGIVCIKCKVRQPIGQFNVMKYANKKNKKQTEIKLEQQQTTKQKNKKTKKQKKDG